VSTTGDRPGGMPDPFQFWRDLYAQSYGQSESAWGKTLEQGMGTEAFASMIGQSLDAYATFHKTLRESLNRYLETMNVPTHDDFGRIGAQIVSLERKVDALDEKLDDIQDRLAARDRLLEDLLKRLEQQDGKLNELSDSLELRDRKVEDMLGRFVAPQRRSGNSPRKRAEDG
jgi:polyhydroxyalkanoic acid synthase PhaR subunit